MSFSLRIFPAADKDVDELAAYITGDSVTQALRFYDAVQSTFILILEGPRRWSTCGFDNPAVADIRKRSVVGFPNHLVFYRIAPDVVEIVRVVHGARDLPTLFADGEDD